MSAGEEEAALAEFLIDLATRIEGGSSTKTDAKVLRRLASQAAGKDKKRSLRFHRRRGQQAQGAVGVDRRLAMAQAVEDYLDEHGGKKADAYDALNGFDGVGAETLKKAHLEYGPFLKSDPSQLKIKIFFDRLAAEGLAVKSKRKKGN